MSPIIGSSGGARKSLRCGGISEGAYIEPLGRGAAAVIVIRNSGLTPAFEINAESHINSEGADVVTVGSPLFIGATGKTILGYNSTIVAESERAIASIDEIDILTKLKEGQMNFLIYGSAKYLDVFGETHHMSFKLHARKFDGERWQVIAATTGNEAD
jgi:hypothetical protein